MFTQRTNKEKMSLPAKGIQVKLADSVTLKQLTPGVYVCSNSSSSLIMCDETIAFVVTSC
jgi:hypothetical protein